MVCGPGRAGKSSLIDSLKNKPISRKKDSTPGVCLTKATWHITEKDGKSHWPEETDDKTHQELFLGNCWSMASGLRFKANKSDVDGQTKQSSPAERFSHRHSLTTPMNTKQGQQISPANQHGTMENGRGATERPKLKAVEECVKQINAAPRRPPKRQKIHFLDIWDFGGQQAYAFLQHMLLSDSQSQHLVAFNGSIRMDAIVPPETFGIDGVEHAVVDLRGQQTYGEVVIGWLDAIYQNISKRGRVLLIGTHLDKVRFRR